MHEINLWSMKSHRLLKKRKIQKQTKNQLRIPRALHVVALKVGNAYNAWMARQMNARYRMEKAEACRYDIQLIQDLTAQDFSLPSPWSSPVGVPDILHSHFLHILQNVSQVHAP